MARTPSRRITRFTVMATLQAARARQLGLSEASAFSWGLNRAIFYAAAKRGFQPTTGVPRSAEAASRAEATYRLGDDFAYRDPTREGLYFTIGGATQTEEGFQRQVAVRFGSERNFRRAWKEAQETVAQFEEEVLRSGRQFYSVVYRPRRDALVAKWTEEFSARSPDEKSPRGSTRP